MNLFGEELRRLRRRSGLSQETLAARAGLSPEAVSLLERGRRSPRLTTMRLLAEGLSLPEPEPSSTSCMLLHKGRRRQLWPS